MPNVRVVGVDWATESKKRAAVELATQSGVLILVKVVQPFSDADAGSTLKDPGLDVVAVDTPFGWPKDFTGFVSAWSASSGGTPPPTSQSFSLRTTDLVVRQETGKQPLSVSADRIGLCARSWVNVVTAEKVADRIDVGQRPAPERPVIEVYPGASLKVFAKHSNSKVDDADFKKKRASREAALKGLSSVFGVQDPNQLTNMLIGVGDEDSDAADAFLAALTALAYLGQLPGWSVRRPASHELALAETEGWIFFPVPT